ncbi:hypothetical protein WI96_18250 [Burkholderia vietnamiensis]|nr:hypothetical protein WI96_18250 [Burkholderia vietnamiensis]
MAFRQYLSDEGIQAHLPGITSSRDAFIEEGKVAISGPYRAKGNEAPVVYVMDADYCAGGAELIKKRNILFTAITRSRGWVKVCGQGAAMQSLIDEFNRLKDNDFQLRFTMPNPIELQEMRTLYRDITADERKKADEFKRAFDRLAEVDTLTVLQTLPKDVRDRIIRTLKDADEL